METNVEKYGGFHMSRVRADVFMDYALQIADAMAFCHSKRTMHRDLKPANICLAADGNIKICDLGLALLYEELLPLRDILQGTMGYMPPEVLVKKNDRQSPRSSSGRNRSSSQPCRELSANSFHEASSWDVYSYAVLLHFMWSGEAPYATIPRSRVETWVRDGGRPSMDTCSWPPITKDPKVSRLSHDTQKTTFEQTGDAMGEGCLAEAASGSREEDEEDVAFMAAFEQTEAAMGEGVTTQCFFPPMLAGLIECMWSEDPHKRPSFVEVCKYLEQHDVRNEATAHRGSSSSTEGSFYSIDSLLSTNRNSHHIH